MAEKDSKAAKAEKQEAPAPEPSFEDAKDPKNQVKVNAESNKFKDESGAVIDATPEGQPKPGEPLYEEKPPLNPYTKAYKANFPERGEELQNYAPTADSDTTKKDAQK